jgi:hypothetical protein
MFQNEAESGSKVLALRGWGKRIITGAQEIDPRLGKTNKQANKQRLQQMRVWGYSSVVEPLPSMLKALNLIPGTTTKSKTDKKW